MNARPSAVSPAGAEVPAVEFCATNLSSCPGKNPLRASGTSWIGTAVQVGSVSVPGWAFPIVAIREKPTLPKFASGTGVQENLAHDDGASAIHSAEVRSIPLVVTRLVNTVPRVRFLICSRTVLPLTFTDVVIVSPGLILNLRLTGRLGNELVPGVVGGGARTGAVGVGADLFERLGARAVPAEPDPERRRRARVTCGTRRSDLRPGAGDARERDRAGRVRAHHGVPGPVRARLLGRARRERRVHETASRRGSGPGPGHRRDQREQDDERRSGVRAPHCAALSMPAEKHRNVRCP